MRFTSARTALGPPRPSEPPPKDSKALVTEQSEISSEIPETSAACLQNVRRVGGIATTVMLLYIHVDLGRSRLIELRRSGSSRIRTVIGALVVACVCDLERDTGSSFVRDRFYNEHNIGSVETETLQRRDPTRLSLSSVPTVPTRLFAPSLDCPSRLSPQ